MKTKILNVSKKIHNDFIRKNSKPIETNFRSFFLRLFTLSILLFSSLLILLRLFPSLYMVTSLSVFLLLSFSIMTYVYVYVILIKHKKQYDLDIKVKRLASYEFIKMLSVLSVTLLFSLSYIYAGIVSNTFLILLGILAIASTIVYIILNLSSKKAAIDSFTFVLGHSLIYSLIFIVLHFTFYIQDPPSKFILTILIFLIVYIILYVINSMTTDYYTTFENKMAFLFFAVIVGSFLQSNVQILPLYVGDSISDFSIKTAKMEYNEYIDFAYTTGSIYHHDESYIVYKVDLWNDPMNETFVFYDDNYDLINAITLPVNSQILFGNDQIVSVSQKNEKLSNTVIYYNDMIEAKEEYEFYIGNQEYLPNVFNTRKGLYYNIYNSNTKTSSFFKAGVSPISLEYDVDDFDIDEIIFIGKYEYYKNTIDGLEVIRLNGYSNNNAIREYSDGYLLVSPVGYESELRSMEDHISHNTNVLTIIDPDIKASNEFIGMIDDGFDNYYIILKNEGDYNSNLGYIDEYLVVLHNEIIDSFNLSKRHDVKVINNEIKVYINYNDSRTHDEIYIASIDVKDVSNNSFLDFEEISYYRALSSEEFDDIGIDVSSTSSRVIFAVIVIFGVSLSYIPPITNIKKKKII